MLGKHTQVDDQGRAAASQYSPEHAICIDPVPMGAI